MSKRYARRLERELAALLSTPDRPGELEPLNELLRDGVRCGRFPPLPPEQLRRLIWFDLVSNLDQLSRQCPRGWLADRVEALLRSDAGRQSEA